MMGSGVQVTYAAPRARTVREANAAGRDYGLRTNRWRERSNVSDAWVRRSPRAVREANAAGRDYDIPTNRWRESSNVSDVWVQ